MQIMQIAPRTIFIEKADNIKVYINKSIYGKR